MYPFSNIRTSCRSLTKSFAIKFKGEICNLIWEYTEWKKAENGKSFSENVLLVYFEKLSEKHKSWSQYSKKYDKHDMDIFKYLKLRVFLKILCLKSKNSESWRLSQNVWTQRTRLNLLINVGFIKNNKIKYLITF